MLRRLGAAERRPDYYDRAIIEYTAAIYHAEQAGHEQYGASIENNLAFLKTLERGDESALLADAFTVQGVVWACLRAYKSSMNALRRAAELAGGVGAHASAGQAILVLIEEHGATWCMKPDEVYEAYVKADRLLKDTQDAEDVIH